MSTCGWGPGSDPVRSARVRHSPGTAGQGCSRTSACGWDLVSAGPMARQGRAVVGLETNDIAGQPRGADMGSWAQGWVWRGTGGADQGC